MKRALILLAVAAAMPAGKAAATTSCIVCIDTSATASYIQQKVSDGFAGTSSGATSPTPAPTAPSSGSLSNGITGAQGGDGVTVIGGGTSISPRVPAPTPGTGTIVPKPTPIGGATVAGDGASSPSGIVPGAPGAGTQVVPGQAPPGGTVIGGVGGAYGAPENTTAQPAPAPAPAPQYDPASYCQTYPDDVQCQAAAAPDPGTNLSDSSGGGDPAPAADPAPASDPVGASEPNGQTTDPSSGCTPGDWQPGC